MMGREKTLLKLGLYHTPMNDWLDDYDKRLEENTSSLEERQAKMLKTNPKYVLKNYMLQEAIDDSRRRKLYLGRRPL